MPSNPDLHGNAPDDSRVALVLIDVINAMEFDGGERLLEAATPMAEALARLKREVKRRGGSVIYVNDNYGRWQSDFNKIVQHALREDSVGRPVAELLRPEEDDYFVLKPKHSGFYSTTLDTLLDYLGARTLIMGGVRTNICVLFTANDGYMRDFELIVPADCVAADDADIHAQALEQIEVVLKADVTRSTDLDLDEVFRRGAGER